MAWISCQGNEWVAAKEVTLLPGQTYTLADQACYCAVVVQGHRTFGSFECEAPELICFGDITGDEYFVSESAAKKGVHIVNTSSYQPLVILQNFANNSPEVPVSL